MSIGVYDGAHGPVVTVAGYHQDASAGPTCELEFEVDAVRLYQLALEARRDLELYPDAPDVIFLESTRRRDGGFDLAPDTDNPPGASETSPLLWSTGRA